MTIARWGIPTIIISLLVLGWGVWLLPAGPVQWLGLAVALFFWGFTWAFFRNPARTPQGTARHLIAPADGLVWDVEEVDDAPWLGCRAVRIGIFLSVFDVHVNRSPIDGTVAYADYRAGDFLDVRHPDCHHANEANTLGIEADPAVAPGLRILVRQLAGLIARRIVCTHGVGDALRRGELYGMIRFGSRTEVWLPVDRPHRVLVKPGDRVRCGETPIIELIEPAVGGSAATETAMAHPRTA